MNIDISSSELSNLELTSVEVSRYSSGGGFAYGRGWVNAYISSLSNLQLWAHRSGNTISTKIQIVDFYAFTAIGISDQGDEQLDRGDANETLTGWGFGSSQGTGKLELGDNSVYSSASKVEQDIDSWSDTSIQFDPVFTGFSEGSLWLFVTNDSGETSVGYKVNFGEIRYYDYVKSLDPDIYHRFNNTYSDEMGLADANSLTSTGTFGFHSTPLTRDNSYAWSAADDSSRIEMIDTDVTNIGTGASKRTIGGWVQLDRVHKTPSGIYKEGAQVNNLYMVVGYGNTILANQADSGGNPDYKIQGYSDIKLSVDRPYHLMIKFWCSSSAGADDGRFQFYVDGKQVSKYAGLETIPNQIKDVEFSNHSGDWNYGKPDGNLDTGGTDMAYPGAANTLLSDWATWSSEGSSTGNLTDSEIRKLFIIGAIPTDTIDTNTTSNMQDAVDDLAGTKYVDKPLPIKIYKPSDADDLTVTFDDVTFDERCSSHVVWLGESGDTLTILNLNDGNIDGSLCETPNGGTITIVQPSKLVISGQVDGSYILILDSSTKNELDSISSSVGDFVTEVLVDSVDVMVIADDKVVFQKFDVSTTSDTVVQIVQENDYVYNNPV